MVPIQRNSPSSTACLARLGGRRTGVLSPSTTARANSEIYLLEVSGGPPHLFPTVSGADNTVPSWSHDGKWLFFSSNSGDGPTQVWKVPYPDGGPAVQVTMNG